MIVQSESDALHLENSLIKENQPKYNILLKDDKTFPSIVVTNERFPQIYSTRKIDTSIGEYYGPYTSVKSLNSVLDLIRKLYKVRTCNYTLSQKNIDSQKFKVCLEYHIGNCLGPCEGKQSESDYMQEIEQAKNILNGRLGIVKSEYISRMIKASDDLNFELAEQLKRKYDLLDKFQNRTYIVNPKITNTDIITLYKDNYGCYTNYMVINEGQIVVTETAKVSMHLDEDDDQILQYVLKEFQDKYKSVHEMILSNVPFKYLDHFEIVIPQIGDKKKLVDISIENAKHHAKREYINRIERNNKASILLKEVKKDLALKKEPFHIECFDNSNIQGSSPVASMVCFKNAKPSRKDYRKFSIKSVTGPDDFASMREVVYRRYFRLVNENVSLPDLIVVDGGKGQLSAAVNALKELGIYGQIPIIGIAKKLEELYYPEESLPLLLSKKSQTLKLLQYLRDEAHRFAITFHRQKRSKNSIKSNLSDIPGIGEKTMKALLNKYGSLKRISQLDKKQLEATIGKHKALKIEDYFKSFST